MGTIIRESERLAGEDPRVEEIPDLQTVVLDEERSARIDAELAREYERVRRNISWSG